MARFDKLIQYFGMLSIHKNVLTNRILSVTHQQVATLKSATKDRIKSLQIPEQPKRPLPAYIRFINEYRLKVKERHPEWNMIEVTRQCAQEWKVADPATKQKLIDAYYKDLEIYIRKQHAFSEALTHEQSEALKDAKQEQRNIKQRREMRKLNRESDKPKRPLGSFIYFVKEKMSLSECKGKKLADIISMFKEEWYALSEENRKKYSLLHENDKARYDNEMEKWETKMIKEGNFDLVRKSSRVITTKPASIPKRKKDI